MVKRISRAFGWMILGAIGSGVIFIMAMAIVQAMVPVHLPMLSVSTGSWDAYAFAQGTWTMDNDKPAFPLQTTRITCRHYNMTCTSAQAEVVFGDTLNAELTDYEVTRWDNDVIIFKNTGMCVDYTYTINRVNQRVIGTRTTKNIAGRACLAGISPKPINLTLTDGLKVYRQLHEEAQAKVFPFAWMAFAVWWVFVCLKIWNGWRNSAFNLNSVVITPRAV